MKNLLILITAILFSSVLSSQNCLPANITLLTQSDVDNFQTTYGTCDTIVGTLMIGDDNNNSSDITSLTSLSFIKSVGSLIVVDNDNLTSLDGLQNIVKNGISKLSIGKNAIINDISQLSNIGPTGGDISIAENPALTTLNGLQGLKTLGTRLQVRDLPLISDLNPLSGITRIDGSLVIEDNDSLTDISGLGNLVLFGSAAHQLFILKDNDLLEDCSPLCFVIQRILPLLTNLTKDIQNNLITCLDESVIISECLKGNDGIYSGSGFVPAGTNVAIEDSIIFDTTTFVIDGLNNRVGIGTNTPAATLEVDGTVKLSGLPNSGTISKIIALDANGNAFEFDISNYDSDASDDFDKAFTSLTDVPAGLADGDDDTQLTDAQITALGYIKSANDADADPMNEIQDLSPYQTIAGAANWDQDASDDFDGAFTSLSGVPTDLADGDDDTQLTDAQITALGYIKSANDADADPTNELYDDSDLKDSITILRADITALESQGSNTSFYNTDGSITGNRAITLGSSDINFDGDTFVIAGSANKVGIGTSTPTYELDVIGDVGISGAIYGLSDKRLKKNEKPIQNALALLSKLNPVTYQFRTQEYEHLNLQSEKQYGLIAQELEKVLPELVSNMHTAEYDEFKSVNYNGLIALLIAAIQDQQEQIKILLENNSISSKSETHGGTNY